MADPNHGRGALMPVFPIHAPPVEGLVRREPQQLLALGKLYHPRTGEFLVDVTDDYCAALARTMSDIGYSIPVDLDHELAQGDSRAESLGRVVALEHRPGVGLFAVPELRPKWAARLTDEPGAWQWSPSLRPRPRNPRTGERMPGALMVTASLTQLPVQPKMSVALSRQVKNAASAAGGTMGPKIAALEAALAKLKAAPDDPAALAEVAAAAALMGPAGEGSADMSRAAVLLSRAEAAESAIKAEKAAAAKLAAELAAERAKVADLSRTATGAEVKAAELAAAVAALTAKDQERDFADLCRKHEARGVVLTDTLRKTLRPLAAETAETILLSMPATRPTAEVGHGGVPTEKTEDDRVLGALRAARLAGKDQLEAVAEVLK